MQEVPLRATYIFEHGRTAPGLYKHQVLAYEDETPEHGARYRISAWRLEVTDTPGRYRIIYGPVLGWHSAEAVHSYYASRWA